MPKVSVIIPTYNRANYICEAIESILSQTYRDFEIIVVDDGSIDDTKEILRKYEGRVKYIYQENKGPSAARNIGIKKSIGDFIAFLDSDDIWMTDKLELQLKIMEENTEVAMMFTDAAQFNQNGIVKNSLFYPLHPRENIKFKLQIGKEKYDNGKVFKLDFYEDLIMHDFIITPTVIVRKECLQKIGYFDEKLLMGEDYNLWLRIAEKYQILCLNKVTIKFRLLSNGLSGPEALRWPYYLIKSSEMMENYLFSCPKNKKYLVIRRIYESYKTAAYIYLSMNNRREFRRLCLRSLVYNKMQFKLYIYFLLSFLPNALISFFKKVKKVLWLKLA